MSTGGSILDSRVVFSIHPAARPGRFRTKVQDENRIFYLRRVFPDEENGLAAAPGALAV
jgi:hypothetical protein